MTEQHFPADAQLVVDAHNGHETWTGQEWNDYVDSATRNGNLVTARPIIAMLPHGRGRDDDAMTDDLRAELRRTVARTAELNRRRDDLIRKALAYGLRAAAVAEDAGLSVPRIYQIRDRRR